jgi:hypothetical protein
MRNPDERNPLASVRVLHSSGMNPTSHPPPGYGEGEFEGGKIRVEKVSMLLLLCDVQR